jgi:hypothetical protein
MSHDYIPECNLAMTTRDASLPWRLVERPRTDTMTLNHRVPGSSPGAPTTQSLVGALARIVAFIALEGGLSLALRVSTGISAKR